VGAVPKRRARSTPVTPDFPPRYCWMRDLGTHTSNRPIMMSTGGMIRATVAGGRRPTMMPISPTIRRRLGSRPRSILGAARKATFDFALSRATKSSKSILRFLLRSKEEFWLHRRKSPTVQ
jgi:hypothetical protein